MIVILYLYAHLEIVYLEFRTFHWDLVVVGQGNPHLKSERSLGTGLLNSHPDLDIMVFAGEIVLGHQTLVQISFQLTDGVLEIVALNTSGCCFLQDAEVVAEMESC